MSDMQDEADRAALEEQLSLPQVLSGQFSKFHWSEFSTNRIDLIDQSKSVI